MQPDNITFFAGLNACHRYKWKCQTSTKLSFPFSCDLHWPLFPSRHTILLITITETCSHWVLNEITVNVRRIHAAFQIKRRVWFVFCRLQCSGTLWVSHNVTLSASLANHALLWLCCANRWCFKKVIMSISPVITHARFIMRGFFKT